MSELAELVNVWKFKYVGSREIVKLARFFETDTDVMESYYLKQLRAGHHLPLLSVSKLCSN